MRTYISSGIRKRQEKYLKTLGAADVEFIDSEQSVIVVVEFRRSLRLTLSTVDKISEIIGVKELDIGFDNAGTKDKTISMSYSYNIEQEAHNEDT